MSSPSIIPCDTQADLVPTKSIRHHSCAYISESTICPGKQHHRYLVQVHLKPGRQVCVHLDICKHTDIPQPTAVRCWPSVKVSQVSQTNFSQARGLGSNVGTLWRKVRGPKWRGWHCRAECRRVLPGPSTASLHLSSALTGCSQG